MDGARFDSWTRRRLGVAAGGAAAMLLGLVGGWETEAKKHNNNNNNNNNNKKKKCQKLGQSCDITQKKETCCNSAQLCAQVNGQGSGNVCCKQRNDSCSENSDCCGNDQCRDGECSGS